MHTVRRILRTPGGTPITQMLIQDQLMQIPAAEMEESRWAKALDFAKVAWSAGGGT